MNQLRKLGALIGALMLAGCSSSGSAAADVGAGANGPLLPWKVGNSWTYRVTDSKDVSTKTTTIGEVEAVGGTGASAGTMANKVVTRKKDDTDQTVFWASDLDGRVVRYREQSFAASTGMPNGDQYWDPYKVLVDGGADHNSNNSSWLESYRETKVPASGVAEMAVEKRDLWRVIGTKESVTVPAGTFDSVVFQKVGGTTKSFWYAPGIGKIKETGDGQVEELVSYNLVP
jgi:hypothetical protein